MRKTIAAMETPLVPATLRNATQPPQAMVLTEVQTPTFAPVWLTQVTDAQLRQFAELIYKRTGIRVSPQKKLLLSNRLRRRLRQTGIAGFGEYYRHLRRLGDDDPEWDAFLQEITTHETYLFRDEPQWDWFRNVFLADCAAAARQGKIAAIAANLVGRVQHRRRAGDRRLLHCRLPARLPALADPDPRHRHRRRARSSRPRRACSGSGPCGWCPRTIAAASLRRPPDARRLARPADPDRHARVSTAQPDGAAVRAALRPR